VLRHHYVSGHGKAIANAHHFEGSKYEIAACGIAKQGLAPIAAPGDEMEAARARAEITL